MHRSLTVAASGKYVLTVSTSKTIDDSVPPKFFALRTIEVARDNIDGITLNVAPPVIRDLKGTIVREGAVQLDRVHVDFQRRSSNLRLMAKIEPDGSFVIPGVWTGRYIGHAFAESGQVVSMRFGDQEALNRGADFDGTEAPLRVMRGGARALAGPDLRDATS